MTALRVQLGSTAHDQLIALASDPSARVNSIWAETLYPPVLEMLLREYPAHRVAILAMRASVQRAVYVGPRVTASRSVPCPYCGDTAHRVTAFLAQCQSCGDIAPPRLR